MDLSLKLRGLSFVLLLYQFIVVAESKKLEKKTTSYKQKSKSNYSPHKGKKQFFPMGQFGLHPVNPYPMPTEYKPEEDSKIIITKGLPPCYDCSNSKYGCCWDGRTPASGPKGEGCPQCRDVYNDFCSQTKELCHYPMVADYCRITCKLCSANRAKGCQSSEYNCCWDGKTKAKGPKGKRCPKIDDDPNAKCEKFEGECLRNPYYMWTNCRKTCTLNLPPIEPFVQGLGSNLGISPACGQPVTQSGQNTPATSYLYPWMPYEMNNSTMGKKTSRRHKRRQKINIS